MKNTDRMDNKVGARKRFEGEEMKLYTAEDFFSGKKDIKPVGTARDIPGAVLLDRESFEKLVKGWRKL